MPKTAFLEHGTARVHQVVFAPDGRLFGAGYAASGASNVYGWDRTGSLVLELRAREGNGHGIGRILFGEAGFGCAAMLDHAVEWREGASAALRELPLSAKPKHETRVTSLEFSPNSSRLAAGCWDCYAKVWDLASGTLTELGPHRRNVEFVTFLDDQTLLTATTNDALLVWDITTAQVTARSKIASDTVRPADLVWRHARIPQAPRIVSVALRDELQVRELPGLQLVQTWRTPHQKCLAVAASSDVAVLGLESGRVQAISLTTGATEWSVRPVQDVVDSVAISPDGTQVACAYGIPGRGVVLVEPGAG